MGHQSRTKIVVWSMETTKYDEEVPKVVGIFAPYLGESRIDKTRETSKAGRRGGDLRFMVAHANPIVQIPSRRKHAGQ